jgi:hypothetical protein
MSSTTRVTSPMRAASAALIGAPDSTISKAARPDEPRQQRRGDRREAADVDLGLSEAGPRRGEHHVAERRQLAAASKAVAIHRGDRGLGQPVQETEEGVEGAEHEADPVARVVAHLEPPPRRLRRRPSAARGPSGPRRDGRPTSTSAISPIVAASRTLRGGLFKLNQMVPARSSTPIAISVP